VVTDAYFAGVIFITVTSGGKTYQRDSLCVDLFTDININQQYLTTVLRPDEVPNKPLLRVSWLVDNALLPTQQSVHSDLPDVDWVTTSAQGAGIQLAIWDIIHDGGDGFSAGSVQSTRRTPADVLAWAVTYEALSLGKSSDLAFVYDNVALNGTPAQMLIGPLFHDGGPAPPAPEPSTLALAAVVVGICGFARLTRRRAR
jgi:hypothetical protein